MQFYDPKTAPAVFDVAWCKWPQREARGVPGPVVRCVLVLDVRLMITDDETEWAAITAAYGTGADKVPKDRRINHLVIGETEFRALGLHKPTVFKLDAGNRQRLPWAEEYFVSQPYLRSQNIVAGCLTKAQQEKVLACLKARGLQFPLP